MLQQTWHWVSTAVSQQSTKWSCTFSSYNDVRVIELNFALRRPSFLWCESDKNVTKNPAPNFEQAGDDVLLVTPNFPLENKELVIWDENAFLLSFESLHLIIVSLAAKSVRFWKVGVCIRFTSKKHQCRLWSRKFFARDSYNLGQRLFEWKHDCGLHLQCCFSQVKF